MGKGQTLPYERGIPFLKAQDFVIPDLPKLEREEKEPQKNQATRLIKLALLHLSELFHNPDGEPYVTLPKGEHHETHRLRTKGFKSWL